MFVRFVPPIDKFVVYQTPSLRPFKKKKKPNTNRLRAIAPTWFLFSLTFWLQK